MTFAEYDAWRTDLLGAGFHARCGTCEHWRAPVGPTNANAGRCELISDVGYERESDKAGAVEMGLTFDSGCGWLLTRADFGCIEHSPRSSTPAAPEGAE